MHLVVGSGPAGVAVATALLRGGCDVTMLDAGLELETERQRLVSELRATAFESWNPAHLEAIREGMKPNAKGVPRKLCFGSDYPFREADDYLNLVNPSTVETAASFGFGGFSSVWGAAVMPYRAEDIADWPIGLHDLADHYRDVLAFMRMSACRDDLEGLFPLYAEEFDALALSRQASDFLGDLSKQREMLRSARVNFGASRLAVDARSTNGRPGCAYCGLCMYGCPYGIIYNSASTVRQLQANSRFSYVNNVVVQRVRESGTEVIIEARHRLTGAPLRFSGERVCLAGGPLVTTRILLESMEAYEQPVELLDSQQFLLPLLRYRKSGRASEERLHTLAHIFLEILDPAVSPRTVHLQVYTYNDLFLTAIRNTLGRLFPLLSLPAHELVDRMLIVIGYLHSDVSSRIQLTLAPPRDGKPGELRLAAIADGSGHDTVRRVVKKLWRLRTGLGAIPLAPLLKIGAIGRGIHSGGTFPMAANPTGFQSDTLGRPCGFTRVHAVDATVLPAIPSTTITLSVMANAHRIGTLISASH